MKRVVVDTGLHEADIRPTSLMSEFKRLSLIDASNYFSDPAKLVDVPCPGCDSDHKIAAFRKDAFLYNECPACHSLFVSPRPSREALDEYYQESKASRYRVEKFEKETTNARRVHLLRSHANWLGQIVDEVGNKDASGYADIGSHSTALFEEIKALDLFEILYAVNPPPSLEAACTAQGVKVTQGSLTGLAAASAFTQLESQFCPLDLLVSGRDMLADGGILFLTTRTVTGFDLQVLWDKTPYIFVPEHLNLLSIDGITRLVERSGLDMIELSTPGQLDLELVLHAQQQDPSIKLPSFVALLLEQRDETAHADFRDFLQKHRLSSHLRFAVQKTAPSGETNDQARKGA